MPRADRREGRRQGRKAGDHSPCHKCVFLKLGVTWKPGPAPRTHAQTPAGGGGEEWVGHIMGGAYNGQDWGEKQV